MSQETIIFPAVSRPSVLTDGGFRIPGRAIPEKVIAFDRERANALLDAARKAAEGAYAPYSNFRVGAAVIMADDVSGYGFTGCNVENASYGATACAERNAIFAATAAGFRWIAMLALSTIDSLNSPLEERSPCGVCRQVISEFADEDSLFLIDTAEEQVLADFLEIDRLLPHRFVLERD